MEKWVVQISEAQLGQLSEEQRNLGTLQQGENGEYFLVFRDSFVALKIASCLGVDRRLEPDRIAPMPLGTSQNTLGRHNPN